LIERTAGGVSCRPLPTAAIVNAPTASAVAYIFIRSICMNLRFSWKKRMDGVRRRPTSYEKVRRFAWFFRAPPGEFPGPDAKLPSFAALPGRPGLSCAFRALHYT
jgi:hypothetical protein